jgi:hypothetical protein
MQQQIRYMSEVRECWMAAKRLLQPSGVAAASPAGSASEEGGSQWSA